MTQNSKNKISLPELEWPLTFLSSSYFYYVSAPWCRWTPPGHRPSSLDTSWLECSLPHSRIRTDPHVPHSSLGSKNINDTHNYFKMGLSFYKSTTSGTWIWFTILKRCTTGCHPTAVISDMINKSKITSVYFDKEMKLHNLSVKFYCSVDKRGRLTECMLLSRRTDLVYISSCSVR